ncbi:MAG: LysR family transcriptional regulator [Burkholderiaceae bacterium]
MKLKTLNALRVIQQSGSLRAAAQTLNLTQPALTVAIRQLEDELGVQLLERTNRGVRASRYGEQLLEHAERILGEVERARQHIAHMRGQWTGTVRFSASPASSMTIVPLALQSFFRDHPEVRVECSYGVFPNVAPQLRSDALDFALTPVAERDLHTDLVCEPLFAGEVLIVCRQGHPLRAATRLPQLRDVSWVYATPSPGPGAVIERVFRQHDLPHPNVAMVCESLLVLLGVVARTDHMTTLPAGFFRQMRPAWPLQAVPIPDLLPDLAVHIVRRREASPTPVVQDLLGWIRHYASTGNGAEPSVAPARG